MVGNHGRSGFHGYGQGLRVRHLGRKEHGRSLYNILRLFNVGIVWYDRMMLIEAILAQYLHATDGNIHGPEREDSWSRSGILC